MSSTRGARDASCDASRGCCDGSADASRPSCDGWRDGCFVKLNVKLARAGRPDAPRAAAGSRAVGPAAGEDSGASTAGAEALGPVEAVGGLGELEAVEPAENAVELEAGEAA